MRHRSFCQRNLKPLFALLVVLIGVTIVWAVFMKNRGGHGPGGRGRAGAPAPPAPAGAPQQFDVMTAATPKGGVNLVTLPPAGAPLPVPAAPEGFASMQLVAGRPSARHAFNTISALILPCVVSIHGTRNPTAPAPLVGEGGLRFADPFGGPADKVVGGEVYRNLGSGFIVDSRGFVLTNHHVVSSASGLLVSVFGGVKRDFAAGVVASDQSADLALIKIQGAPALPEARLGNSGAARVGDWVLAFGAPFGLDQTVTQGILSNRRSSLSVEGVAYGEMLQTDAPTNRGSSGGPLVDMNAEVIGVNTAIFGPNGAFSGTGFAVPIDRAKVFLARCGPLFDR